MEQVSILGHHWLDGDVCSSFKRFSDISRDISIASGHTLCKMLVIVQSSFEFRLNILLSVPIPYFV